MPNFGPDLAAFELKVVCPKPLPNLPYAGNLGSVVLLTV